MAALAADPAPEPRYTVYPSSNSAMFAAAIRGQDPTYDPEPAVPTNPDFGPSVPNGSGYAIPPSNYAQDPFLGQPMIGNYDFMADPSLGFGLVGPQPYKFGWTSRYDVGWLPKQSTSDGLGDFSVFEVNAAWRYANPIMSSLILAWTPEFNYRSWAGPDLIDLPGHVYRFASDVELSTPANAPWSVQLGFTPAFVTDFADKPDGEAFNWDGRGVLFYRASQQWMFAFGAAYWDRVHDQIIPYAGVVWTPHDRLEMRLMFPKARISYFVGNWWGAATWLYGAFEYNVEAYQIGLIGPDGEREKIQIADYRAVIGLRTENMGVTGFIEGGWVFERKVDFAHGTPDFDIGTGAIARMGLRF